MNKGKRTGSKVKTLLILAFFIAAAVLSVIFAEKVAINYDLSSYLGDKTETRLALDVIDEEFGMTGSVQVMAKNVSAQTAEEMRDKIEELPNVLNVGFDKNDEAYYKDGKALFTVLVDGDDYSDTAKQVTDDVKAALAEYEGLEYGGTAVQKHDLRDSITSEMNYIFAISICLVIAILLITSESWLEPFVLLAASGVAVLINRGTNIFFDNISYITNSIAAILQLALSVDYSIVLLHAYRREKESGKEPSKAMSAAIRHVLRPVSASALTTIFGLLALLFMSFTIGFDIGMVLIKGIVISAITSLTLLPALVLLLDKPLKKTSKRAFVPKGKGFCTVAFKAGKAVVPIALAVIILCGCLQTGNNFIFTDTNAGNTAISDIFGENNTVAVVYKNGESSSEKERELIKSVTDYKTTDGKTVLSDATAYSTTVREAFDIAKAADRLDLDEDDVKLLFTMYGLYSSTESVKMTFPEFVSYACDLTENDADAKEFASEDTSSALGRLLDTKELLSSNLSADEFRERLNDVADGEATIDDFSVKQMYGLYFYGNVSNKYVPLKTMLSYLATDKTVKTLVGSSVTAQMKELADGIAEFEATMTAPMTPTALQGFLYQNCGMMISEEQAQQLFGAYFMTSGEQPAESVPFLKLMTFLAQSGQMPQEAAAQINTYNALYEKINTAYNEKQFVSAATQIAQGLTGQKPSISANTDDIRQIYILYFRQNGKLKLGNIGGKEFIEFIKKEYNRDSAIRERLAEKDLERLNDLLTVGEYMDDEAEYGFEEIHARLAELQNAMKSGISVSVPEKDEVSGVYIKYAAGKNEAAPEFIEARDLLDFVSANMDTNTLLKRKMSYENRTKVEDSKEDIADAEELFIGENHSRLILSVDLPNEGDDTTEFVNFLSDKVSEIFGDGAYIAGETVTTVDLEKTFSHDNIFITVFTLVSIFLVVAVIFRSLSLPVILVAAIQGAIFIAMSTQLLSSGVFFMSYIVSTCILMGATIDYGILMSSNYVAYRHTHDKKEALRLSVEAAMPTVFTSGLILTVCGFVISFVSSQNSISTVGRLIGIGTICSVVMITVVLPCVLYILDGFVLKLSIKKKDKTGQ